MKNIFNHRHLVVGPLFCFLFLLSIFSTHSPLASLSQGEVRVGRIVAKNEEYVPVGLDGGMMVLPGGVVEIREDGMWELIEGSLVVYGKEWVEITFRDSFLRGYDGAFYVVAMGDYLTIAALTSPVLFTHGEDHMIIPVETQWRMEKSLEFKGWETWFKEREVQLLPSEFLQEHAVRVHSLENRFSKDVYDGNKNVVNVLDTLRGIVSHVDGWIMASVHPHLRDRAWVVGMPEDAGKYDIPLRLLMFPSADVLSQKADTFTVERWMRELRPFLDAERDPGPFFNTLIKHISDLVIFADSHNYPERSKQYREVLRSLTQSHGYLLTRHSRAMLDAMQSRDSLPILATAKQESVESAQVQPEETPQPFDAAMVENVAYEAIRNAGALFTVETKITPISSQKAKIDGVVFGDSMFSFVYDLMTGEVNQIMRDDQSLPYAVSLKEFMEWAVSK